VSTSRTATWTVETTRQLKAHDAHIAGPPQHTVLLVVSPHPIVVPVEQQAALPPSAAPCMSTISSARFPAPAPTHLEQATLAARQQLAIASPTTANPQHPTQWSACTRSPMHPSSQPTVPTSRTARQSSNPPTETLHPLLP
jgi:hypothetical protein